MHHWTVRFEAKHRLLKQLSTRMGNIKNLALSLASRHQSLQCYLLKENVPLLKAIECGPGKCFLKCYDDNI